MAKEQYELNFEGWHLSFTSRNGVALNVTVNGIWNGHEREFSGLSRFGNLKAGKEIAPVFKQFIEEKNEITKAKFAKEQVESRKLFEEKYLPLLNQLKEKLNERFTIEQWWDYDDSGLTIVDKVTGAEMDLRDYFEF